MAFDILGIVHVHAHKALTYKTLRNHLNSNVVLVPLSVQLRLYKQLGTISRNLWVAQLESNEPKYEACSHIHIQQRPRQGQ